MAKNDNKSVFSSGWTRRGLVAAAVVGAAALSTLSAPVLAGSTWDGLKGDVFGQRRIENGLGIMTLKAPVRPEDQRAVPVDIEARFADGRTVKSVTLVVDENPMPVSAVFNMGPNQRQVSLKTNIRLNQQTEVRAIVEASDGALYMASQLVKFAGGQAACAAPPTGNPEEIAANMGKMQLTDASTSGQATQIMHDMRLRISHPNHTGMALDQQTLLYIPLRMISSLEVMQGDVKLFDMIGSITLSENPVLEFPVSLTGEHTLNVVLKDSDGTEWKRSLPIQAGS
ncbi:MAG: quinoprotein dehydrogenase-associated SoxYZ-like carrier [Hyphomicrobiaceae bacterium]|nr:quinoprotein dehydrogenase-associated SoxYZ-like carrier [Hyphomicrobiaceae bacterium]